MIIYSGFLFFSTRTAPVIYTSKIADHSIIVIKMLVTTLRALCDGYLSDEPTFRTFGIGYVESEILATNLSCIVQYLIVLYFAQVTVHIDMCCCTAIQILTYIVLPMHPYLLQDTRAVITG